MNIKVAGAGAGKTSNMAQEISDYHKTSDPNKNIYCIAFTNNAVAKVKSKLEKIYGELPHNIKVSTIHSFLFQEIIRPYYYLLYGNHYQTISLMNLPAEPAFRAIKIRELDSLGKLHVSVIPERAKWVMSKKSSDNKREKDYRKIICSTFASYCAKIYIDEAQDIDKDMAEIIESIDKLGVEISLIGDPKQDLRGYGSFRELINKHPKSVQYINNCYRCPKLHLLISNSFINANEQQSSEKLTGSIDLIFESDLAISDVLKQQYDLAYIYQKNTRVETHESNILDARFERLRHELSKKLQIFALGDIECKVCSYNYATAMLSLADNGVSPKSIMQQLIQHTGTLSRQEYAAIISLLTPITQRLITVPVVSSIEAIKGLEGSRCLFILSSDLAAYLFKEKTAENKIKNALYVGLTRSLNHLSILITTEVENKYTRSEITTFLLNLKTSK